VGLWIRLRNPAGLRDLYVPETIWSPSVQRKIRLEAGQTAPFTIFADDISGLREGDYCVACKRIRIVAGRNGRLTVRLTPENAGLRLAFDYPDLRPNEPFPVTAGQEVTVLGLIRDWYAAHGLM
jgi:hypothetical protein